MTTDRVASIPGIERLGSMFLSLIPALDPDAKPCRRVGGTKVLEIGTAFEASLQQTLPLLAIDYMKPSYNQTTSGRLKEV
jgi:hypothetical protein